MTQEERQQNVERLVNQERYGFEDLVLVMQLLRAPGAVLGI